MEKDILFKTSDGVAESIEKLGFKIVEKHGITCVDTPSGLLKISTGTTYVVISNGKSKIQIVYGSKNNTIDTVKNKFDKLFKAIQCDGDYLVYHNNRYAIQNELSDFFGVKVTKKYIGDVREQFALYFDDHTIFIKSKTFDFIKASFKKSAITWNGDVDGNFKKNSKLVNDQHSILDEFMKKLKEFITQYEK